MNTGLNYYSDYGSGSSSNSSTTWPTQETWANHQPRPRNLDKPSERKSTSYQDLVTGKCTLEDIMKEFQMNGLDSPYTPDEDRIWGNHVASLGGMGPSSAYLRQKSWPEPERSPAPRLPRPRSEWIPSPSAREFHAQEFNVNEFNAQDFTTSTPVDEITSQVPVNEPSLTEDQLRVLNSLPNAVLFSLLHEMEQSRGDMQKKTRRTASECRFCKNNGERESYYRSHALKDARGRVACPVLRAFVCRRCGARGDAAHTIKYCPLSTADERMKSAAMMRSVRMASGRRRASSASPPAPAGDHYMVFGETTPSVVSDNNVYNSYALTSPLDPLWAALEQKLML